jgi:hypothetical protein
MKSSLEDSATLLWSGRCSKKRGWPSISSIGDVSRRYLREVRSNPGFPIWSWYCPPQNRRPALISLGAAFRRKGAQRERGVGELSAVAVSVSGIQVAVAGVMTCAPATRTSEQDRPSGCRMWPTFGSQIGYVG